MKYLTSTAVLALLLMSQQTVDASGKYVQLKEDSSGNVLDIKVNNSQKKPLQIDVTESKVIVYADQSNTELERINLTNSLNVDSMYFFNKTTGVMASNQYNKSTKLSIKVKGNVDVIAKKHSTNVSFLDINYLSKQDKHTFDSIIKLAQLGILKGKSSDKFYPKDNITRGEFSSVIAKALGLVPSGVYKFKDKGTKDIQALSEYGILKGYSDGTIRSDNLITRQQMAIMLYRASKLMDPSISDKYMHGEVYFDDITKVNKEALDGIRLLAGSGGINIGRGIKFNPNNYVTRSEVAKMFGSLYFNSFDNE